MMKCFLTLVILCVALPLVSATEKPNIIVILADDLGFGDVSCNGAKRIATPHIDRLAKQGIRFTSAYSTASTCTPTRYSLLTGKYAFRTKGTGVAAPNAPAIIPAGTETVASILKRAGYSTAVIGKWHLGLGDPAPEWNGKLKPGPLEIGFDHAYILPTTNDRVPQVIVEDHRVRNLDPKDPLWVGDKKPSESHPTGISHRNTLRMDWSVGHNQTIHNGIGRIGFYTGGIQARFRDEDLADLWMKHTAEWIERHQHKPFFIYLNSHSIHVPRITHERYQGKSAMGPRGDSILELDGQIGELLATLDRLKLTEKTLILFTSDNGPVLDDGYKDQAVENLGDHLPSGPFRGGKYSVYEGGTRVPFLVSWPGRIAPAVNDKLVSVVDLPASFASLVGEKPLSGGCPDSQDLHRVLLGEASATARDHVLQQDNNGNNFGLRVGNWKYIRLKPRPANQQKTPGKELITEFLFDLSKDPHEDINLADSHSDQLNLMRSRLEQLLK